MRILTLLFVLLFARGAKAQDVRVEAVLDTGKMRIGEQVHVDLYVNFDARQKNLVINWPEVGDTLGSKVEVINVGPIDTTLPAESNSSRIFQHQRITVSVYDSGYYNIPPLKFTVGEDSARSLFTRPLLLEVHTVPTDTSLAKTKDIKPPLEEPFNWKWYLKYIYWAVAILLLIAAVVIFIVYMARKRRKVVVEPEKPKVPPHITALAALEKIKEEQVWREGRVKEFYSAISETVRQYIEHRFFINALESTTDEIMLSFRSQVVDQESKDRLQQLLTLSDLVKFAKMSPIEAEHQLTLANAFDFVRGTMREEPQPGANEHPATQA